MTDRDDAIQSYTLAVRARRLQLLLAGDALAVEGETVDLMLLAGLARCAPRRVPLFARAEAGDAA